MERVAIFVDVQNVYYTCRQAYQRHFDYNAFWAQVTQSRQLAGAFAYAIQRNDEKQRQFQNILRGIGFNLRLKPFIQRSDGTAKGDWDVGITIDILDYAQQADVIILLSGDGDFDLLAQRVRQMGKRFEVYGVESLTAQSLIRSASIFHPITDELLIRRG